MTTNEKEEKKRPKLTELFAFVSVMVSIIIAGTSLLNFSGNVPLWWFHFSFIVLIALAFFTPFMVFAQPISEKMKKFKLKRKQNAVARKYFPRFKDLVDIAKSFASPIRSIEDSLRTHYENRIQNSLAMHVLQSRSESEIRNSFFEIEERLNESDKSFRDLYLIMKQFEFCLNIYTRHLKIIEVFAHEIMVKTEKPIAKGIEAEFEAFREKFNDFVKDFQDYYREVNKELGEIKFPEWAIDYVKKW